MAKLYDVYNKPHESEEDKLDLNENAFKDVDTLNESKKTVGDIGNINQ